MASLIHMGHHVTSIILLSGNESEIILHVTKQNKQTNKNVYHSYQDPRSLKIRWLFWSVGKKTNKSIRHQKTGHLKSTSGPKMTLYKKKVSDYPEWMRKTRGHLSIKTMEKKRLEVKCIT